VLDPLWWGHVVVLCLDLHQDLFARSMSTEGYDQSPQLLKGLHWRDDDQQCNTNANKGAPTQRRPKWHCFDRVRFPESALAAYVAGMPNGSGNAEGSGTKAAIPRNNDIYVLPFYLIRCCFAMHPNRVRPVIAGCHIIGCSRLRRPYPTAQLQWVSKPLSERSTTVTKCFYSQALQLDLSVVMQSLSGCPGIRRKIQELLSAEGARTQSVRLVHLMCMCTSATSRTGNDGQ